MQVADWKGDELSHTTVLANYAQHNSLWGMIAHHNRVSVIEGLAEAVDLAHDSLTLPVFDIALLNHADKLMSEHAAVTRNVPSDNLKVLRKHVLAVTFAVQSGFTLRARSVLAANAITAARKHNSCAPLSRCPPAEYALELLQAEGLALADHCSTASLCRLTRRNAGPACLRLDILRKNEWFAHILHDRLDPRTDI